MTNKIVFNREYSPSVKMLKISAPEIARAAKPGQFVVIMPHESSERIPITIADSDKENGTITIVFKEVGATTQQLGCLKEGDSIAHLLGPLGHPTEILNLGRVVVMGGGVGIAVIFPIVKAMKEAGNHVITIVGAVSKSHLFMEEELKAYSSEYFVTTEDGTEGQKGRVTDILKEAIVVEEHAIKRVVACGPVPMMRAVTEVTRGANISTIVSLNPLMLDATGMCGVCRVTVGGTVRFACVEGPEFDAHLVDFDELCQRLMTYSSEEKIAVEKNHKCKLGDV